MSAYGHQMEREFSGQNLLIRGGSENESQSTLEMGVYMSSFAATVFIGGLVTVGVSVMTLLIALIVMLQDCQSQNAGVVEMQKWAENSEYCRILAFHVELNNLDSSSLPSPCKEMVLQNIRDGHYLRQLNDSLRMVEIHFSNVTPGDDGQDVVLMDVDDLFPSEFFSIDGLSFPRFKRNTSANGMDARHVKQMSVQTLYVKLRDGGWNLILLSRKHERFRNTMVEYLNSVGCNGWSSLIMRVDDEMPLDSQEYISRKKTAIQKQGFRIVGAISSQMDFVAGPIMRGLNFKLPNIMWISKREHHVFTDEV
ncbi:OLC1v1026708C1 [Oldenlandia corymbosa var. corymbosa]|uniref:OLC1v1026708C1 n=1 Tax=Oldenlandia corymbosa var. corymbosa TaxID=529605 RepID=A0AAV1C9Q0_OLDCO|nr:OLC1v1026708C1 [Oldenlandia corymbosa var. corymbosa]